MGLSLLGFSKLGRKLGRREYNSFGLQRCCDQLLLILSFSLTLGHVHLCVRDDGLTCLFMFHLYIFIFVFWLPERLH